MNTTHRLMVIHPCAKNGKPMSNQKKVMGRTRICTDRWTDRQTNIPWTSFMGGIIKQNTDIWILFADFLLSISSKHKVNSVYWSSRADHPYLLCQKKQVIDHIVWLPSKLGSENGVLQKIIEPSKGWQNWANMAVNVVSAIQTHRLMTNVRINCSQNIWGYS